MKMESLPALSDADIRRMCSRSRSFVGCVRDNDLGREPLPTNIDTNRCWFVLYQPRQQPDAVGHWVLVYWHRRTAVFFDPFGMPPSQEIERFIRRLQRRTSGDYGTARFTSRGERSNEPLEEITAESCGWWCVMVLQGLDRGESLRQILRGWSSTDQGSNEQKLIGMVQTH